MDITFPIEAREIQEILPHRFPFLLLDRVTAAEPGKSLHAFKTSASTNSFSKATSPNPPLCPAC